MDETSATKVLKRFDQVIKTVAKNVAETFSSITEAEDVTQEASILILSYAGLVPDGRLPNELNKVEHLAVGNEDRVKRLIATQLRMDLNQHYGRESEKTMHTQSLDALPENLHPTVDFASTAADDVRAAHFPYLYLHYANGQTSSEIAEIAGVARSTVTRRIAKEKHAFLTQYVKRAGLVIEGDEDVSELLEAYGHLKAAGR